MDAQSIWLLMTIGPSTEKVKLILFMKFPLKLYLLKAEESWNKTNKQDKFSSKWKEAVDLSTSFPSSKLLELFLER